MRQVEQFNLIPYAARDIFVPIAYVFSRLRQVWKNFLAAERDAFSQRFSDGYSVTRFYIFNWVESLWSGLLPFLW